MPPEMLGSPKLGLGAAAWAQNVIQRQVKHMAWLLDDLLDVARITQGKLELKKQPITLNSVVDSAVEAARPLIDAKESSAYRDLADRDLTSTPTRCVCPRSLSNLLTNAAKYTDAAARSAPRATV